MAIFWTKMAFFTFLNQMALSHFQNHKNKDTTTWLSSILEFEENKVPFL